ncbi:hypothetical protein [Streptomyces longisporus]|uniref:Secreted protein n=1 Tax=Streptomyces longisporus TaxID=1948 RepID=A0ABP5ZVM6_STRLO
MAALATGAALCSLAVPTPAVAESVTAVQITVCNDAGVTQVFWVRGYNQHNDWVGSPIWTVNAGTSATGWDYWWKQNSSVELHHEPGSAAWTWMRAYVPRTDARMTTFRIS